MAIVVGLDIGSSAVRAVEVATRGRSAKVRKSGRVPLPPGAVEGGQVREPAEVTKAVRRLWHETKFSTRDVRLGIGSGSVLVRPVELEWMPAADLKKAMRYLVADLLPVPVDEANIDHVLLGETEREGRRMAKVLLVATARDAVDDVVRAVAAGGLRPTTADLSPLALIRFAARHQEPVTEAVVDIGVDKLSVAVHTCGLPRFVRVIPGVGGGTLTRALAEATGEEPLAAEQRKHHTTFSTADVGSFALRGAAVGLAEEVRDTLQFHATADPEHPAERILVTGLGGATPGFAELVSQTVGLPATMLDLPGLGRKPRPGDPPGNGDLAVSFGLCLGDAA
jgi:type IV pilus assembly protein PilM